MFISLLNNKVFLFNKIKSLDVSLNDYHQLLMCVYVIITSDKLIKRLITLFQQNFYSQ